MDLRNFRLDKPAYSIALEGLGFYWDLHAFAELTTVRYLTTDKSAELKWVVPSVNNPWGDTSNSAIGCILKFRNVSILVVAERKEHGTDEEHSVASMSQVTRPAVIFDSGEFRVTSESNGNQDLGLLFELQSGRTIEIHAGSAELVPL